MHSVALQNMLLLAENFTLKVLTRLAHRVLGISKLKYFWQFLTICMSLVLNIFIKKRLITKSNNDNSDFTADRLLNRKVKQGYIY